MHECEAKDVCVLLPNPGAIYAKGLWVRVIREIMKKGSQVEILRKNFFSEPPTGVEPITFQILVGRSNH